MALEDMGVAFVKLGQILATRADLLPPDYQAELAKLQDHARPLPAGTVEKAIQDEFGAPPAQLFGSFDTVPLAAASVGQAHAATLKDGSEVVVKVRRPGAVEQVEEDLAILAELAAVASRRWEIAEQYDVMGLAREFEQTLTAELDYVREGRNAERFARNFVDHPDVHIPRVFEDTSTAKVLTLERIHGVKIDDIAGLEAAGIDRHDLAERAARVVLKMVFEDGFFHADPHPGNFFIEEGGRIGLIDFGMVGSLDARTREQLARLLLGITGGDSERLIEAFLELGVAKQRVDRTMLSEDLGHLMSRYYGRPLSEMRLGPMLEESLEIMRRHRLHLPPSMALLLKTLAMHESLGTALDPDFQMTEVLGPYVQRMMLLELSPKVWARRLGPAALEAARLGADLPVLLRRLVSEVESGNLEVGMRPQGFEPIVHRFERLANRIVLGILAAALINGLAILMSVYNPTGWQGWIGTVFGVGFLLAVGLGGYVAWGILRSR
jgi:ubiquinone biosynthesis protein